MIISYNDIINHPINFRNLSNGMSASLSMALRVPFGISTPGWLGIVALFVTGLYQI
jgi:hypothetical protein